MSSGLSAELRLRGTRGDASAKDDLLRLGLDGHRQGGDSKLTGDGAIVVALQGNDGLGRTGISIVLVADVVVCSLSKFLVAVLHGDGWLTGLPVVGIFRRSEGGRQIGRHLLTDGQLTRTVLNVVVSRHVGSALLDGGCRRCQRALAHLGDRGCQRDSTDAMAGCQSLCRHVARLTGHGLAVDHCLVLGGHGQLGLHNPEGSRAATAIVAHEGDGHAGRTHVHVIGIADAVVGTFRQRAAAVGDGHCGPLGLAVIGLVADAAHRDAACRDILDVDGQQTCSVDWLVVGCHVGSSRRDCHTGGNQPRGVRTGIVCLCPHRRATDTVAFNESLDSDVAGC